METLRSAGFVIEHDPVATRAAWSAVPRGAAEACGCATCAAWLEARPDVLDDERRGLLERLGLDPERESELALLGPGEEPRTVRALASWAFAGTVHARPSEEGPLRFSGLPARAPEGLLAGPLVALELEISLPAPAPA